MSCVRSKRKIIVSGLLVAFFLVSFVGSPLFAQTAKCDAGFGTKSSEALNQRLVDRYAKKFPHLEILLKDGRAFEKEMRRRHAEQQVKTPATPDRFDFSEIGIPEVKIMEQSLVAEILELKGRMNQHSQTMTDFSGVGTYSAIAPYTRMGKKIEKYKVGLEYLEALQVEAKSVLAAGKIDYQSFNELAYFYARATGYFDREDLRTRDNLLLHVEEKIQGYKKFSIKEEFGFYKERSFELNRGRSLWTANRNAMEMYRKDYTDQTQLPFIMIPSHAYLGPDIFHRLMINNVYLVGITRSPIGADGFHRPGGLFWIHDVVHSALIYSAKKDYMQKNELSEKQFDQLSFMVDKWFLEMENESKAIANKQLRRVTRRLLFNIHHDRGLPIVPSSVLNLNKMPNTAYALYFLLENFGHGVPMPKGSHKNLTEAYDWVVKFWSAREHEELKALKAVKANLL